MTAAVSLATLGNGPAFSAYQSSIQSLTASTYTKMQLQTEEFDTNNCFDTSLYRFTPTVAGYYICSVACQMGSTTAEIRIVVYKNGSASKNLSTSVPASNWTSGSALIYCNGSTDYLEAYVFSGVTNTTFNSQAGTYFQASLARGA
jgi:hypothetical protein